jgi:rRNA maturation endonuclease Nob1
MHYVCIENNTVISILSYAPAVPDTVSISEISDADHNSIIAQTHYFDVSTKTVKSVNSEVLTQRENQLRNADDLEFLRSTDWQVMRHIRQKALGITTSLSEADYLQLEQQRHQAASRIV